MKQRLFIMKSNNMYDMVQADMKEEDYQLSEEHKKILDERLASNASDPPSGSKCEEVKSWIKDQI